VLASGLLISLGSTGPALPLRFVLVRPRLPDVPRRRACPIRHAPARIVNGPHLTLDPSMACAARALSAHGQSDYEINNPVVVESSCADFGGHAGRTARTRCPRSRAICGWSPTERWPEIAMALPGLVWQTCPAINLSRPSLMRPMKSVWRSSTTDLQVPSAAAPLERCDSLIALHQSIPNSS